MLVTCLDALSENISGRTEENHETHRYPVLVPRSEHWGFQIQSSTGAFFISVTFIVMLWASSVSVVTTSHARPVSIDSRSSVGSPSHLASGTGAGCGTDHTRVQYKG